VNRPEPIGRRGGAERQESSGPLGRAAIEAILPHRAPFLFVDRVTEIHPGERIVGVVRVSEDDRYVVRDPKGNFWFPPTLLTEAMAQVGAILVLYAPENRGRTIFFRAIERARLRRAIPAGASVEVVALVKRLRGRLGSLVVKAYVEQKLAARAVMAFALLDQPSPRDR